MRFELISNRLKATKEPKTRNEKIIFSCSDGDTICYHQPLYVWPLKRLQGAIYNSSSLAKLKDRYYRIESNSGYIWQYYPAVEYYKIAFRMITDNVHTIILAKQEVKKSLISIQLKFKNEKEFLPGGQSKISFGKEIYKLRSDIFTFVLKFHGGGP